LSLFGRCNGAPPGGWHSFGFHPPLSSTPSAKPRILLTLRAELFFELQENRALRSTSNQVTRCSLIRHVPAFQV